MRLDDYRIRRVVWHWSLPPRWRRVAARWLVVCHRLCHRLCTHQFMDLRRLCRADFVCGNEFYVIDECAGSSLCLVFAAFFVSSVDARGVVVCGVGAAVRWCGPVVLGRRRPRHRGVFAYVVLLTFDVQ
jgi:hypothetical protein